MKRKLTIVCGLLFTTMQYSRAQQQPYYSQYILNNFILNPALAGIENYWDFKTSYRNQWEGINGAPTTAYLTVHGPIGKGNGYDKETPTTVHDADDSHSGGKEFWMEYTAPPAHMGVGLTILSDKTGPLSRIAAYASYAYHLPVTAKMSLSMGVSVGAQELTVNVNELNFGSANPVDPSISQSNYLNQLKPDINAGLWLSSVKFFLGVSAQQIVPLPIDYSNQKISGDSIVLLKGKLIPHLFFTAGYKLFITDDVTLLPSVMVTYVQPVPVGVDLNAKVQYQDLFWVGVSYKYNVGFAGLIGININSSFNLGYSYDYNTTPLGTVSKGTHEIVLGFLLRKNNNNAGSIR
ncbi:MAG: type IX secretion system membrane protein PorP/SprF [Bacteroidota bacterium]|nr:type IX secretion system membrane protein PorP/SprF [Bacteroidota bacterium]